MEYDNQTLASTETTFEPSFVELTLRSPVFATIITISGLVLAIVFSFKENWALTVATLALLAALLLPVMILNHYSRMIRRRFEHDSQRLHQQHEADRNRLRLQLQELRERDAEAAEALHKYIHRARDCAAQFVATYEKLLIRSERGETDGSKCDAEFKEMIRDDFLRPMLEEMLRVFYPLVPHNSNLWAAIRELRLNEADGKHYYHTLVRAGVVNQDRAATTEPIPETDGLPAHLRQEHSQGRGIVLLSKKRSPDKWRSTKNDTRQEDIDLMAGPVFLKRTSIPEMIMILFLNSPRAGALSEEHKVYMKCCTDVLSMFFNTISSVMVMEFHAHTAKSN